jgi:hypothetical protein
MEFHLWTGVCSHGRYKIYRVFSVAQRIFSDLRRTVQAGAPENPALVRDASMSLMLEGWQCDGNNFDTKTT